MLGVTHFGDRLLEVAKTEKDPKLRRSAIQALGSMNATKTGDALVSMYGSETDPALKRAEVLAFVGVKPGDRVADIIAGRDPQLEKAIDVAMKQLAANPPEKDVRPPFPKRAPSAKK